MELLETLKAFEKQASGFLGVAVGTGDEPDARLHADEKFPAASLIKIPILIHLFKENELGKLDLQETIALRNNDKVGGSGVLLELHEGIPLTLLDLATLMIVVSDNTATNLLIDRLGIDNIQARIQAIGMNRTALVRKLMIVLDAPSANCTSPSDMYLLYRKLTHGELLSPAGTKQALEILSRQQYNEKIPLLLPKETKVAHKTGEISGVRHDCGVVDPENQKIIVCLLTKNLRDELKGDRILAKLSLAIVQHYGRTR